MAAIKTKVVEKVEAPRVEVAPVATAVTHPGRTYFVGFVDGDTPGAVESKIHGLGGNPPGFVVVVAPSLIEATGRFQKNYAGE